MAVILPFLAAIGAAVASGAGAAAGAIGAGAGAAAGAAGSGLAAVGHGAMAAGGAIGQGAISAGRGALSAGSFLGRGAGRGAMMAGRYMGRAGRMAGRGAQSLEESLFDAPTAGPAGSAGPGEYASAGSSLNPAEQLPTSVLDQYGAHAPTSRMAQLRDFAGRVSDASGQFMQDQGQQGGGGGGGGGGGEPMFTTAEDPNGQGYPPTALSPYTQGGYASTGGVGYPGTFGPLSVEEFLAQKDEEARYR